MCKLQDLRSHNVPGGLSPDGVWLATHGYEWLRGVLGTSNDAQPPPSPSLSVPHPRDKRAPPYLSTLAPLSRCTVAIEAQLRT